MAGVEILRPGAVCVEASRAFYWWPGDPPKPDALELVWNDGTALVFDTRSDWTMTISRGPWRDPFDGVDVDDPSWDLGKWTKEPLAESDRATSVIGSTLRDFTPRFNEVGEFVGLNLIFDTAVITLGVWGGDLTVRTQGPGKVIR